MVTSSLTVRCRGCSSATGINLEVGFISSRVNGPGASAHLAPCVGMPDGATWMEGR